MNIKVVEISPTKPKSSLLEFAAMLWRRPSPRSPEVARLPPDDRAEFSRMEGEGGHAPLARPSAP